MDNNGLYERYGGVYRVANMWLMHAVVAVYAYRSGRVKQYQG
jgi:hypothetical protein